MSSAELLAELGLGKMCEYKLIKYRSVFSVKYAFYHKTKVYKQGW